MTTGLVAALPAEMKCLHSQTLVVNRPYRIAPHIIAIISGMGANQARRAADLLQFEKIDGLVSWGTAAGLAKAEPGDLLLPDFIIGVNGRQFPIDNIWRQQLIQSLGNLKTRIHTAPLAETRLLLETPAQKQALFDETGAIAADMESAVIAKVAQENHIPCLVVRTVVDRHDQVLPYHITRHTDSYGKPNIHRILLEILSRPGLLPHAIRLSGCMQKAMGTLKQVARQGYQVLDTG